MNVSLIFQQTGYNFQISQFTPLSFIYEVARKVFQISSNNIKLFYKEQYVPNEQTYASNYFKKFPVIINILEKKDEDQSNNNEKAKTEEKIFNETLSEKTKQKKKNYIKCQICSRKNSIFYCRNCNHFICFECNLRYPEHFSHKKISLESGDLLLCFEDYRNSVLEQLNELNNAYRFSSENIYSDQKRAELFDNLMNTLKDLDKKTQSLTIMGTSYKCNNQLLNNFNKELREIEPPKYKEETINSFGLVNEKELEINNYISFINLQILKSKFNKKMTIFFNEAKKIFNELMVEINNKLHDSLYLKEKDYNDLVLYNKEKYKKNDSSSSKTNSKSSSSKSLNKSYSFETSTIKNIEDNNKLSDDKFSSSSNINKNDLNSIITRHSKKKNSKNFENRNKNSSFNNLINYKNNHTDGNIKKINSCSVIVKEDNNENNESNDDNLITLPKIKDSNIDINNNKKILFNPIQKTNKKQIISLINMNNVRKSLQNILLKSKSQSKTKDLKQLKKGNNNYNSLKLFELEKSKNLKSLQLSNNNNNNDNKEYKQSFSFLKLINNHKDNQKINEENKNLCANNSHDIIGQSVDNNETNNILKDLIKIKPNHKIKFYDTFKVKENDEHNNNDKTDLDNMDFNIAIIKKRKNLKEIKKKRIYQKEK